MFSLKCFFMTLRFGFKKKNVDQFSSHVYWTGLSQLLQFLSTNLLLSVNTEPFLC